MTAPAAALNALTAAAVGKRSCENCQTPYAPRRKWSRFCSDLCRRAGFEAEKRARIIHDYLSELGRKGAAARKARRA